MHPPNTTCNHLISPAAAADSSIPFAAADQDDDICSSSIITNNCNDGCDLINFPINSSPNSLYYTEFQYSINYLFQEDFFQQYQFNYDYPNPSPDPPAAAAAAGYHHHHYQSDEIVPPLPPPPPPPPPLNMRPLENSDNICSTNENNNGNTNNYGKSKRTCKKDRHSKIHTSKGLRDRRMRLSLDVARKFFRLQDLLGFDKASRTVDWLLTNSDNAIRELTTTTDPKGVNSGSCTSDDVLEETQEMPSENKAAGKKKRGGRKGKPTTTATATATAERARVGRESRRKARERARERTSQKRRLSLRCQSNRTSTQQEKLRSGFAESSEKEYSGNDEASWNNSYGYLHCTADAAWI